MDTLGHSWTWLGHLWTLVRRAWPGLCLAFALALVWVSEFIQTMYCMGRFWSVGRASIRRAYRGAFYCGLDWVSDGFGVALPGLWLGDRTAAGRLEGGGGRPPARGHSLAANPSFELSLPLSLAKSLYLPLRLG